MDLSPLSLCIKVFEFVFLISLSLVPSHLIQSPVPAPHYLFNYLINSFLLLRKQNTLGGVIILPSGSLSGNNYCSPQPSRICVRHATDCRVARADCI